jgi:hypothetical protein
MNQTMQHARKRTEDFTGYNSAKKEEAQPVIKMLKPPLSNSNTMTGNGISLRMSRKPGDSIYSSQK